MNEATVREQLESLQRSLEPLESAKLFVAGQHLTTLALPAVPTNISANTIANQPAVAGPVPPAQHDAAALDV